MYVLYYYSIYTQNVNLFLHVNLLLFLSRWWMQSSWLYCVRVRHTLLWRQAAKYVCMYVCIYVCMYVNVCM